VLRPTEVLIFGNPQGGTPLMESQQSLGIELPLNALVWQDASGQGRLGSYMVASSRTMQREKEKGPSHFRG